MTRPRDRRRLFLTILMAMMVMPLSAPVSAAQEDPAPFCQPGQTPRFQLGLAQLKDRLGDTMGEPLECDHEDPASGDLLQQTTTGLAFYRPRTNTPTFSTGVETWALSPRGRGLLLWTGGSVNPPEPTAEEHAYLRRYLPILDRELEIYDRLGPIDLEVEALGIDHLDPVKLAGALGDWRGVEEDFAGLLPPPRLGRWHAFEREQLGSFGEYLELTLRARRSADPAERAALLGEADRQLDRGVQAGRDANTAFEAVLPREVDLESAAGFGGVPR